MDELKKETVRIAFPRNTEMMPGPQHEDAGRDDLRMIEPPAPQSTASEILQASLAVVVPARAIDAFDSIPRWLCWGLFFISVIIFLIQIWNYTLS